MKQRSSVDKKELLEALVWFVNHGENLKIKVARAHRVQNQSNAVSEWMIEENEDFEVKFQCALIKAEALVRRELPND